MIADIKEGDEQPQLWRESHTGQLAPRHMDELVVSDVIMRECTGKMGGCHQLTTIIDEVV